VLDKGTLSLSKRQEKLFQKGTGLFGQKQTELFGPLPVANFLTASAARKSRP